MANWLEKLNLEITPIVAYGLVAIVFIFGLLGLEKFKVADDGLRTRLETAQRELSTLNQIKETDIWSDRLVESTEKKASAVNKVWTGTTNGVVAAQLQQSLRTIFTAQGATGLRVNVDPQVNNVGGIDILTFDLSTRVPAGKKIIDVYQNIADHKNAIVLTEISAVHSLRYKRPTQINMSGIIPIRVQADKP